MRTKKVTREAPKIVIVIVWIGVSYLYPVLFQYYKVSNWKYGL